MKNLKITVTLLKWTSFQACTFTHRYHALITPLSFNQTISYLWWSHQEACQCMYLIKQWLWQSPLSPRKDHFSVASECCHLMHSPFPRSARNVPPPSHGIYSKHLTITSFFHFSEAWSLTFSSIHVFREHSLDDNGPEILWRVISCVYWKAH